MRISAKSVSGMRLRGQGVASKTLCKVSIYQVPWLPKPGVTIPLPFLGAVIFLRQGLLKRDSNGDIEEIPELVHLIHQLCHVHQRLEWGLAPYLWRHVQTRIRRGYTSVRFSQVERECYKATQQTLEFYKKKSLAKENQSLDRR
jgi:hypothetical protein